MTSRQVGLSLAAHHLVLLLLLLLPAGLSPELLRRRGEVRGEREGQRHLLLSLLLLLLLVSVLFFLLDRDASSRDHAVDHVGGPGVPLLPQPVPEPPPPEEELCPAGLASSGAVSVAHVVAQVSPLQGTVRAVLAVLDVRLQPQVLVLHVRLEDALGAGRVLAELTLEVAALFVHGEHVGPAEKRGETANDGVTKN